MRFERARYSGRGSAGVSDSFLERFVVDQFGSGGQAAKQSGDRAARRSGGQAARRSDGQAVSELSETICKTMYC